MGRPLRFDIEGAWHHVVNRGADRQATFRDARDFVEFERLLGVGHERFGVVVHAYCLMTNHFHLLVQCPDGGLSDYMHLVTSTYARHFNDRTGRDGPLFRGRFRSFRITGEEHLLNVARYIHRNPRERPGVPDLRRYRWSSHRVYLEQRRQPSWLSTEAILDRFVGGSDSFDRFVCEEQDELHVGQDELSKLVEIAIELTDDLPPRQGLDKTVTLLVTPPPAKPSNAQRVAIHRATQRARNDPRIARLADQVRRMAA